uniref:Serine-threonine/tyrosine-protein kinase catalytic domain-containing protein n=1 Tax=Ditylenchus dipsaci TaxID=166011 RepID=A0A915EVW8_9BILA
MPQLYNILKEGYRMESPHNCPDEIYSVMVMCWQDKADQRPHFKTIADYFDWMLVESANQTNKSDDGETTDQTDEGPYAVINETPDKGNDGKRKTRPFSAPGLMSFEAFASTGGGARELTDMAGEEENVEVDEKCPLISSFLEEHQEVHSVDLITKHPHAFGSATNQEVPLYTNTAALPPSHDHRQNDVSDASSYFFDSAIGSPLMSPLEPDSRLITYENFDSGVRSTSNTLPRITSKTKIALNQNTTADHPKNQSLESRMHEYVNKQSLGYDNQLSKPSTATTTTTANSSNKSLQSSSSSSSSSSNSSKENRGASKFSNARDTVYKLEPFPTLGLPPMRPVHTSVPNKELNTVLPKKSVVSEHRLKVNGVNNQGSAFSSSAQQNRKIGFIGQAGSSGIGLSKQSSTSNESNNSAVRKTQLNVDIRSGHVQRSRSVESTKSSGHGGSSAMSSAEGLGLCQVEYIMIEAKEPNKHAAPVAIKDNNSVKYN